MEGAKLAPAWRQGRGPAWFVVGEAGSLVTLARWVRAANAAGGTTLQRDEQPVSASVLRGGLDGWRPLDPMEVAEAQEAQQRLIESPAAEAQQRRREALDPLGPTGSTPEAVERMSSLAPPEHGVTESIAAEGARLVGDLSALTPHAKLMRDLHGLALSDRATADSVRAKDPEVQSLVAQIVERRADLLEEAAGRLDELHGPIVDGWRCDECGSFIPNEVAAPGQQMDMGWRDMIAQMFDATLVLKRVGPEYGEQEVLAYIECRRKRAGLDGLGTPFVADGEVVVPERLHGPMRRVRCRVTADSPDPLLETIHKGTAVGMSGLGFAGYFAPGGGRELEPPA